MRIVIATGGTGGHIYPALSLAKAIKEEDSSSEFLFIGSTNRMEATEIPNAGYAYKGIDVIGMNGSILSKIKAFYLLKRAEQECKKILIDFKPNIVIGFGNYISVPVLWAASSLHIPTMIHEQNSFAGKANKMLAKSVDAVVGCYEENLNQFPQSKTKILGNPRASEAAKVQKDKSLLAKYNLSDNVPLVVIVMGSLGSESVNEVLKEACGYMQNKEYQALIVTGKKGYDSFTKSVTSTANVHVVPYIEGIEMMSLADLVVVRGGATTSAEITALGLPSIIIPSPYVPNNHQVLNALALQNKNAAIMIEEKDLTATKLVEQIQEIISNPKLQNEMAKEAKNLGRPHASQDMIRWIKNLVGEDK